MAEGDPIDERLLELLERRMEQKVLDRVDATLKWRYSLIGVAVASAFGLAGYSIKDAHEKAIERLSEAAEKQLDTNLETIKQRAADMGESITRTLVETEVLKRQADARVSEVSRKFEDFGDAIHTIDAMRDRQKELEERTKSLFVSVGELTQVEELRKTLASVGAQVERLSQIVAQVPTAAEKKTTDGSTASGVQKSVATLVQKVNDSASQKKPTVFIQFSGGKRERAEKLGEALEEAGYNVPPEDREADASKKHEVRYFEDGDLAAAQQLAVQVNTFLKGNGYDREEVTAKPAKASRSKPRSGVLELWIDLDTLG